MGCVAAGDCGGRGGLVGLAGDAVGGGGFAGAEVLEVFQSGVEVGEAVGDRFDRFLYRFSEDFGVGLGAQVEDELAGGDGLIQLVGQFGDEVTTHEVDGGNFPAEAIVGTEGHLEVGDFGVLGGECVSYGAGELIEDGPGVEACVGLHLDGAVQPA